MAVARGVLANQHDFAHALRDELVDLAQDQLDRLAAVVALHERDGAERAALVAAVGDLDVGARAAGAARPGSPGRASPGSGQLTSAQRIAGRAQLVQLRDQLGQRGPVACAEKTVDRRQLLVQLAGVALDQAAGGDQFLVGALAIAQLEQRVDRLLLGGSMKPHVLTTTRSAEAASAARAWPAASSSCAIASESTVFLVQPSETMWNDRAPSAPELASPRELHRIGTGLRLLVDAVDGDVTAEPLLARMTTDSLASGSWRCVPAGNVSASTCLPSTAASTYTRAFVRNSTNIPSMTGVGEAVGSGVGVIVGLGEAMAIGNGVGRRAPAVSGYPRAACGARCRLRAGCAARPGTSSRRSTSRAMKTMPPMPYSAGRSGIWRGMATRGTAARRVGLGSRRAGGWYRSTIACALRPRYSA